ncbi:hypothetical protein L195_g034719 [Trifolium pratense]|uniref:Uncharacterized protein n=1 Tax=Trifolium pratense TaxID=57577 RepID=A0A2K3LJM2_TRIPR|nr:hypothetical protein L195_g034719 [Trifolium pratense]
MKVLQGPPGYVCPFQDNALYSGWIRFGPIRVRYLPILRDPHVVANPLITVDQIDQQWLQHMDCVFTSDMLGSRALILTPRSDVVVQEESSPESSNVSHLLTTLGIICDMIKGLIISDEVANDSRVYQVLQDAEKMTINLTFV